jgi:hypothetical protein
VSRWFRFYADAIRNPKVIRLSDKEFRLWVKLMAVASENEGHIPPLDDLKLLLSMRLDHLSSGVDRLISGGLIDLLSDGYEPHNWKKFQYKSDTSTERVTKHRAKRNVSETPPDTDTDTEKKKVTAGAAPPYAFQGKTIRLKSGDLDRWRKAYPDVEIEAHLQSRDDWLSTEADEGTRRKWFVSTSNYLAGLQAKAGQRLREPAWISPC